MELKIRVEEFSDCRKLTDVFVEIGKIPDKMHLIEINGINYFIEKVEFYNNAYSKEFKKTERMFEIKLKLFKAENYILNEWKEE